MAVAEGEEGKALMALLLPPSLLPILPSVSLRPAAPKWGNGGAGDGTGEGRRERGSEGGRERSQEGEMNHGQTPRQTRGREDGAETDVEAAQSHSTHLLTTHTLASHPDLHPTRLSLMASISSAANLGSIQNRHATKKVTSYVLLVEYRIPCLSAFSFDHPSRTR